MKTIYQVGVVRDSWRGDGSKSFETLSTCKSFSRAIFKLTEIANGGGTDYQRMWRGVRSGNPHLGIRTKSEEIVYEEEVPLENAGPA